MAQRLFHVTPAYNYPGILKFGLLPQLGKRSAKVVGETPSVFLFVTRDDVTDALNNWLGDEFEEETDEPLLVLQLDLPDDFPLDQHVDWEKISHKAISSEFITGVDTPVPADPPVFRARTVTGNDWICGAYLQIDGYSLISQPGGPIIIQRASIQKMTHGEAVRR